MYGGHSLHEQTIVVGVYKIRSLSQKYENHNENNIFKISFETQS